MNTGNLLKQIHERYRSFNDGKLAAYIPELAKVNSDLFAISVVTTEGEVFQAGDHSQLFTMQSSSKPFTYAMALSEFGREKVRSLVGVEPTGTSFNSLVELEANTHRPYNPMVNAGAIAISSVIAPNESLEQRRQLMLKFFGAFAGRELTIDEKIYESERSTAHRNRAIAHLLRHFRVIEGEIDPSLDLYFSQCSIQVNTRDLAMMAATLAHGGVNPEKNYKVVDRESVSDVLSIMFSCGMYDTAGEWAYQVGIPAKSGVSGCIFGVIPGKMGIAVYSPLINEHGHSVRGVKVMQDLSHELKLHIFR
jgi:glutaminase